MKSYLKVIMVAATLAATTVYAAGTRTEPNAVMRSATMQAVGGAMKVLGGMAGGQVPFDATAATAAKEALVAAATSIPTSFATQGETDAASEAKADIWANWDDFALKATALSDAATALDVSSVESIGAGMGALGGACKDCHTAYRM